MHPLPGIFSQRLGAIDVDDETTDIQGASESTRIALDVDAFDDIEERGGAADFDRVGDQHAITPGAAHG